MSNRPSAFYVTGGTLRPEAPSYVERQADRELLEALLNGEFCYVLTSRQMGKSSLMVRTAQKLREQKLRVAVLDLTAIGQNVTPDQWYDGLLMRIGRQLGLEDELEQFWAKSFRLSPLQRLISAVIEIALPQAPTPIVLFVDESDIVRSLPFSTDEFFAAIRETYNRRTEQPELQRLRFCLLGVATPTDLIRDTRLTPFNIGRRIDLTDFTSSEAAPLARGLAQNEQLSTRLLDRVLHWSGGHPYLTQRLCHAIWETNVTSSPTDVDRLCADLFLSPRGRERDDNLIFVRERILNNETARTALLDAYSRVHRGRRFKSDESNPVVSILNLSGITRSENSYLKVRNRIYAQVFDRKWIRESLPEQEKRRQRRAYRQGAAFALLTVAVLVFMTLPVIPERSESRVTTDGKTTKVKLAVKDGRAQIPSSIADAAGVPRTSTPIYTVLAIKGEVLVRRAGAELFDPAYTNLVIFPGDLIRVGPKSQLTIRSEDDSTFRFDEKTEFQVLVPQKRSLFRVLRGIFYWSSQEEMGVETTNVTARVRG